MNLIASCRHACAPILLFGASILCVAAPAFGAPERSNGCLQAELAKQTDFSGVVLLRRQDRHFVAAHGAADAAGTPLTADTRFNLGSANKMFTAIAVAQLAEQGKLALDAPAGKWVDGLAPAVAAVTLRQLLTHSGGLGNFVVPENLAALQRATTVAEQMALIKDTKPQFEPGSRFAYSNTGFLLLGRAVEKASGLTYAAYLDRHVFKPAGMSATSLQPELPTRAATGFTRMPEMPPGAGPGPGPMAGPPPRGGPPPSRPLRPAAESALPGSPAGSAYSTVGDMARFFDALLAGKLVSDAWVKDFTRAHIGVGPANGPQALQYGLGFGVATWEGRRSFGHNGGAPGVNVEAQMYPDDKVLIVILANRDPPAAAKMLSSLRREALGGGMCQ